MILIETRASTKYIQEKEGHLFMFSTGVKDVDRDKGKKIKEMKRTMRRPAGKGQSKNHRKTIANKQKRKAKRPKPNTRAGSIEKLALK